MKAFQRILAALLKLGTKPKRARQLARQMSSKLNVKVPRGRPGGGPLRPQDRQASRDIRDVDEVIARKRQAKKIREEQKKRPDGARRHQRRQEKAKERREFYKEEVEGRDDFAQQQLLEEFNEGKISYEDFWNHVLITKAMRKHLGRITKRERRAAARKKAARQMKLPLKQKPKGEK